MRVFFNAGKDNKGIYRNDRYNLYSKTRYTHLVDIPTTITVCNSIFYISLSRTAYRCEKEPTGELNRDSLIGHINDIALNSPDVVSVFFLK